MLIFVSVMNVTPRWTAEAAEIVQLSSCAAHCR